MCTLVRKTVLWYTNTWTYFHTNFKIFNTVYKVIFAPGNIFALLHLQPVSPRLEFAQTQFCLTKNNLRHWDSPSLIFASWQPNERGEIKTGANISMYIVDNIWDNTKNTQSLLGAARSQHQWSVHSTFIQLELDFYLLPLHFCNLSVHPKKVNTFWKV